MRKADAVERIAIVCPNYHPQICGVGDHSMRLAQTWVRQGHQVRIFTRAPAVPHPEAPQVGVFASAHRTAVGTAWEVGQAIVEWGATRAVLQYTPQMLNATRFGSAGMPALAVQMRDAGVPLVTMAHELAVSFGARPDVAVSAVTHRVQALGLLQWSSRFLLTVASRAQELGRLARAVGISASIELVGVPPNALPVQRHPATDGTFTFGTFSTVGVGRRFDVVLDAFANVAARFPQARLVLIGDLQRGHPGLIAQLQNMLRTHAFADRIRCTGQLPLTEVAQEVARLDAYVFANDTGITTRSGTLPLGMGTPLAVVASHGTETDALFVPDENFVQASALDGPSFANAMQRVVEDAALRGRVAQGALELYRNHMAWDAVAEKILG